MSQSVCFGDGVSHRCTVGNVALHIDFTVCDHHAIYWYLEKCFFSPMAHLQRACVWRNLWGHEYVDEYPEGAKSHWQHRPEQFYIRQGQSVGLRVGKRQGKERNVVESEREGTEVIGCHYVVLFFIAISQQSVFPTWPLTLYVLLATILLAN